MEGVKIKTRETPSEMEETETQGRKRTDMMSNISGKKQAGKIEKQKNRKTEKEKSRTEHIQRNHSGYFTVHLHHCRASEI